MQFFEDVHHSSAWLHTSTIVDVIARHMRGAPSAEAQCDTHLMAFMAFMGAGAAAFMARRLMAAFFRIAFMAFMAAGAAAFMARRFMAALAFMAFFFFITLMAFMAAGAAAFMARRFMA